MLGYARDFDLVNVDCGCGSFDDSKSEIDLASQAAWEINGKRLASVVRIQASMTHDLRRKVP
jgi:hypothetical protein